MRSGKKKSKQETLGVRPLSPVEAAAAASRSGTCPLEDADAIPMWSFYRANRDLLITDVRLHREDILAALRSGEGVEAAFRPYFKDVFMRPIDTDKPKGTRKAGGPAWPWNARPMSDADSALASRSRPGPRAATAPSTAAAAGRATGRVASRARVSRPLATTRASSPGGSRP